MKNQEACTYRGSYPSPYGYLEIQDDGEMITEISIEKMDSGKKNEESALTRRAYVELMEYLQGKRKIFDLPVRMQGTEFQIKVWKELQKIPYGTTISYGELARRIGNKKACRAVGGANNKNKILIVIPCHRVVGANGALVGFAGGIELKQDLLKLEADNK